jgi:hypothetical protein
MLQRARLVALTGLFCLLVACGGGGGGSDAPATNQPPAAHLLASGEVGLDGGTVHAAVGGNVVLDASGSSDADHDALSFTWTLVTKPAGSTLSVAATGTTVRWQPDLPGTYTFSVQVTDSKGAVATQQIAISADNSAPSAAVSVSATFTAVAVEKPVQPVTVGSSVVVDATATTDPDGDPVDVTFQLNKPAASAATLSVSGRIARFSADALGTYQLHVRGVDGRGASFETVYVYQADNRAPTPVTVASATAVVADGGSNITATSVGYDVLIDGSASSDADGDTITRSWSLSSRPAGSAATLTGSTSGPSVGLSPDVLGDYVVVLTVSDPRGASSRRSVTVRADNRRPTAVLTTNATPQALPAAPNVRVPLGTNVTLRGGTSVDADGDTLTYAWFVDSRPAGSTAVLSSTTAAAPTFTADAEGSYVFRLRVTDTKAAFSERTVTLSVGGHAPVAVVDRGTVTVLAGSPAQASAALSFDEDGDAMTYQWSVDARPTGSTATIATTDQASVNFTPDVAGTYVLAVRVSDGSSQSIAYVTLRALAVFRSAVTLNVVPDEARYSLGLDRVVIASANPNTLRTIDPFTGATSVITLPTSVKNFSLSPDGRLAAVLHEGLVSLIDLTTATLVRSTATGGAQTDAFVTNAGLIYLIGQTGGQWVGEPIVLIDGWTGTKIPQPGFYGGAYFYGTQLGVLAGSLNKVFFVAQGLSPSDISWFTFDRTTSNVTAASDSPYHGDYGIDAPLWMSGNDSLVFTRYGTYFRSDTLNYAGRLAGVSSMTGFSHSAATQEALVLQPGYEGNYPYTPVYPGSYLRFTGPFLLADTSMTLPPVGGQPTYGIRIFHSAGGSHVALVQTGSASANATGIAYHVVTR